jgi:hypothetical protein
MEQKDSKNSLMGSKTIHVIGEVVALGGILYYVSSQTSHLNAKIVSLEQKVLELTTILKSIVPNAFPPVPASFVFSPRENFTAVKAQAPDSPLLESSLISKAVPTEGYPAPNDVRRPPPSRPQNPYSNIQNTQKQNPYPQQPIITERGEERMEQPIRGGGVVNGSRENFLPPPSEPSRETLGVWEFLKPYPQETNDSGACGGGVCELPSIVKNDGTRKFNGIEKNVTFNGSVEQLKYGDYGDESKKSTKMMIGSPSMRPLVPESIGIEEDEVQPGFSGIRKVPAEMHSEMEINQLVSKAIRPPKSMKRIED